MNFSADPHIFVFVNPILHVQDVTKGQFLEISAGLNSSSFF